MQQQTCRQQSVGIPLQVLRCAASAPGKLNIPELEKPGERVNYTAHCRISSTWKHACWILHLHLISVDEVSCHLFCLANICLSFPNLLSAQGRHFQFFSVVGNADTCQAIVSSTLKNTPKKDRETLLRVSHIISGVHDNCAVRRATFLMLVNFQSLDFASSIKQKRHRTPKFVLWVCVSIPLLPPPPNKREKLSESPNGVFSFWPKENSPHGWQPARSLICGCSKPKTHA